MPLIKFKFYQRDKALDVDVFWVRAPLPARADDPTPAPGGGRNPDVLVTPEDLILLKLIAHRPRDLGDIEDVLLVQGDLDPAYMRRWAGQLGVGDALEQMLREAGR